MGIDNGTILIVLYLNIFYYLVVFVDNNSIGTDVWFDNVQVSHFSGQVLEENHYYPFGLTISESINNASLPMQPYKYNGKELEKSFGLEIYEYGARQYDPQIGRWKGVDPLADKYVDLSPFVYTANNPVRYVDYDGRHYGLYFDEKTVTVRAHYYAVSKDIASAQASADLWNNLSGKYSYKTKDGSTYTINFDITVIEVKPQEDKPNTSAATLLNGAANKDRTSEANMFRIVHEDELPPNSNGETYNGVDIKVRESRKDSETGAHEIGHSIGLLHYFKGLMTPTSTDAKRSEDPGKQAVDDMIKFPLRGTTNKYVDVNGTYHEGGTGTLYNNSGQSVKELKGGTVIVNTEQP